MIQTPTPKPLNGPLRARINKLAHSCALHYEARIRAALLAKVQTARDGGATFDQLAAMVAGLEAVSH